MLKFVIINIPAWKFKYVHVIGRSLKEKYLSNKDCSFLMYNWRFFFSFVFISSVIESFWIFSIMHFISYFSFRKYTPKERRALLRQDRRFIYSLQSSWYRVCGLFISVRCLYGQELLSNRVCGLFTFCLMFVWRWTLKLSNLWIVHV